MGTTAERLRKQAAQRMLTDQPRAVILLSDAADELDRLTAENADLKIAIYGGCGCPAPFDECEHDEPMLDQINRLVPEVVRLTAENERLREALAAVLPTFDGDCYFDHHGDCQAHHADKLNGRCSVVVARETMAASLSETGGEG